jgi:hypothetical protein
MLREPSERLSCRDSGVAVGVRRLDNDADGAAQPNTGLMHRLLRHDLNRVHESKHTCGGQLRRAGRRIDTRL